VARISRNKLPRGVKLTIDHVFTPLQSIETQLQGAITTDNLKDDRSTFRLNFNFPFVRNIAKSATADNTLMYKGAQCIPFVLPPLQEDFSIDQVVGTDLEYPTLEELSFGFDQRSESCSITGPDGYNQSANEKIGTASETAGFCNFANVGEKYGLEFIILEKNRVLSTATVYTPDTDYTNVFANTEEIFNLELPGTAFISSTEKLNPFNISDIGRPFQPYKSYLLLVNPTSNYIPNAFVSLTVSLKFSMKMMQRDNGDDIANIPDYWEGEIQNATAVSINVPAGDSQIEADSSDGVQANIQKVDQVLAEKLKGSYNKWSHAPPQEHLKDSAGYEVITVPVFGGMPPIIGGDKTIDSNYVGNYADYLPYIANAHTSPEGDNQYPTFDRRIIPLVYPMTIHHVVLGTFVHPDTTTSTGQDWDIACGVGLGTGMVGDEYTYQQVAYLDINNSVTGRVIDYFDGWETATYYDEAATDFASDDAHCDLINIPLVYDVGVAGTQGTSYKTTNTAADYLTGKPVFAGRGYSQTKPRININQIPGDSASAVEPKTIGSEQWLEVRLKINPNVNWSATTNSKPIFYGTFWVYIIGKKHLTKVDI